MILTCLSEEKEERTVRDGPLEKLGGGGEFSSRRNFFSSSNCLYEFFLTRGDARAYHELLQGQRYANESLAHS